MSSYEDRPEGLDHDGTLGAEASEASKIDKVDADLNEPRDAPHPTRGSPRPGVPLSELNASPVFAQMMDMGRLVKQFAQIARLPALGALTSGAMRDLLGLDAFQQQRNLLAGLSESVLTSQLRIFDK